MANFNFSGGLQIGASSFDSHDLRMGGEFASKRLTGTGSLFGSAGSFLARLPSRSRNPRRSKAIQLDRAWIAFWIGIWIASWIAAESTTLTLTNMYFHVAVCGSGGSLFSPRGALSVPSPSTTYEGRFANVKSKPTMFGYASVQGSGKRWSMYVSRPYISKIILQLPHPRSRQGNHVSSEGQEFMVTIQ